jgi:hypothetical protein
MLYSLNFALSRGEGVLWSRSNGSRIYNYLCNQCLSPLMLWVWIPIRSSCTTLCDKVCQWLATGWWFSLGTPVSSTNKTDHHEITEILLKVVFINQTKIALSKGDNYYKNVLNCINLELSGKCTNVTNSLQLSIQFY